MTEDTPYYSCPFLNQYLKIPKDILDKINIDNPQESESVCHCIGLIVVNLLVHSEVAYSRNKNFYTENRTSFYTWTHMLKAVDVAEERGYARKLHKGHWNRAFESGLASTLGRGQHLSKFSLSKEIELGIQSLPLLMIDNKPIFDKRQLSSVTSRSAASSSESHTLLHRLDRVYSEALKLNREYWNHMEIDCRNLEAGERCLDHVGLTRVFKDGGVGRWFQKGGLSFQELSKEERLKLFLNGEEVVELDYPAMHPHLIYAWEGMQCPEDFYERVMVLSGCSRFIAKSVVLIAVNARSYKAFVAAINRDKGQQARANRDRAVPKPILYDELKKYRLHPKDIIESVKKAHPVLAKYIYSGLANKLMLEESDIMTTVLLRLMELGIPALPVHDSVIVPLHRKTTVRRVMEDEYKEQTGFEIVVG
jgi:hypothetical protein